MQRKPLEDPKTGKAPGSSMPFRRVQNGAGTVSVPKSRIEVGRDDPAERLGSGLR